MLFYVFYAVLISYTVFWICRENELVYTHLRTYWTDVFLNWNLVRDLHLASDVQGRSAGRWLGAILYLHDVLPLFLQEASGPFRKTAQLSL